MKKPSTAIKTCIALGTASLAALNAQAIPQQITYKLLGLTSQDDTYYASFSYDPITFAIANTGPYAVNGSVNAISGYYPGKGFFNKSFFSCNTPGGPNQAMVSSSSITLGATIDSSTTWSSQASLNQGLVDTYYGIRFDEGGGNYNYGWVKVKTPGNYVTFVEAGVEQSFNTSVLVGETSAVPEPSTNALLALAGGGAALVALRRKRAAQTASRN